MTDRAQDEALINAAVQGSARAWEKLVRCYERRVYNYGLRLTGNPTDAMDLMQEVFVGVYRNLHRFRGDARFSSWLFRIAHNKAVDMNRRQRLVSVQDIRSLTGEEPGPDYDGIVDERSPDPQQSVLDSELNQQIAGFLQALPMEQRLLVELKVFQSLTFEEIAEMQDISTNTAKTRFYTALRKLKTLMETDNDMPQIAGNSR